MAVKLNLYHKPPAFSYAVQGGLKLTLWMKLYCVTIQMKAIEQYFHVVLFIMLYRVFRL